VTKNKYVDFVSDKDFEKCVKHVIDAYKEETILEDKELQKNGIDAIKMTFDMWLDNNNFKKWRIKESARQKDKTLGNRIGEFHQMLLGKVDGWTDLGEGDETKLDLKKDDNTIFIELKNKFNTINSTSGAGTRKNLLEQIKKHDAKGYFGYFIDKNGISEETEWVMKKGDNHKNLKRISGGKLYEMITEKENALEQVWSALPLALKNINKNTNPLTKKEQLEFKKWFDLAYKRKPKVKKKSKVKKDN